MADLWPASLPQLLSADGYSEALGDGMLVSDPDNGAFETGIAHETEAKEVKGQIMVDWTQAAALRTFARAHTCARFEWEDYRGNQRWFTFVGPPKFLPIKGGLYFSVKLDLLEYASEFGSAMP